MDRRDRSQVSYAKSAQSRSGQAVIKLVENATGRLHLIQRARDYDAEIAQGMMDFLRNATYGLSPRSIIHSPYGFEFEERYKV